MAAKHKPAKMSDVASLAGVSLGTVSNYFNRPEKVSEERRSRVEAAVEQLGFRPSGLARALVHGHHPVVGLVVLDFNNPYFSVAARGMEDRLTPEGIMVTVSSSDDDPQREKACIQLIEENSVAGMVITPCGPTLRSLERMTARGTPAVLFGCRSPMTARWCAVAGDDALGGALIGRHLLELGHERVGYLNGLGRPRDIRSEAVRGAIEAAGHKFTEIPSPGMTVAGGEVGTQQLIDDGDLPTALVCANDLLALGALRVLQRHGIRVPDDIALTGYDDVDFARSLSVPLTTVRHDAYRMGTLAAGQLLSELRDPDHEHQELLLAPELIVRASTIGAG